jgi:hypothetical protein
VSELEILTRYHTKMPLFELAAILGGRHTLKQIREELKRSGAVGISPR